MPPSKPNSAPTSEQLVEREWERQFAVTAAPTLSPEMESRITQSLQKDLVAVRPLASIAWLTALLCGIFLVVALAALGMMNTVGFAAMQRGQMFGISAILAAGVLLVALSLAWYMTPGSLRRVPAPLAVGLLALAFLAGLALLFPWKTPVGFLHYGLHCLRVGMMVAAPAALLFAAFVWRGAPLGFGALGASLGAISGLLAVTILQFTCSQQDANHLMFWHGAVLLLSTLAGAVAGYFLRRRGAK